MGSGHYINNQWMEGSGDEFFSEDPSTGHVIWSGKNAEEAEIQLAIESATKAFSTWRSLSINDRISFLEQFQNELKKQSQKIAETISLETGKPLWEAKEEVASMVKKVPLTIQAFHERCQTKEQNLENARLFTRAKPHGVVVVLGPFNLPGHLSHGHILPALLAGNVVIFKSSELTPLISSEIFLCWEKIGLPKGVLQLLQGGHETGHALVVHPKINGIYFTGSLHAGLSLRNSCVNHPEKIIALEMGGNNPLVIAEPGDLEAAAYATIQSAFLTAGQRCSCARRLIVQEGKEGDEFLKVLTHMTCALMVGRYTDQPEPFMGPVINQKSMENLLNAQAILGTQGGNPLVEMKQLKENASFLSPGIMDVTAISKREDEELFGPFLQLIRVHSFEEAIQEANRTQFGLCAGLISKNEEKFRRFYEYVDAGVINWNHQTTAASSAAPFGGIKKSGNHHPSGYYAVDYCSYPVASIEKNEILLPSSITPGIEFLGRI